MPTRGIAAIVNLACGAYGEDYWQTGRTLERLGLKGMSIARLKSYITHDSAS